MFHVHRSALTCSNWINCNRYLSGTSSSRNVASYWFKKKKKLTESSSHLSSLFGRRERDTVKINISIGRQDGDFVSGARCDRGAQVNKRINFVIFAPPPLASIRQNAVSRVPDNRSRYASPSYIAPSKFVMLRVCRNPSTVAVNYTWEAYLCDMFRSHIIGRMYRTG